jgi:hypothetical protein
MLDTSPDDLADLYAIAAVHEFPFSSPGFPPRFEVGTLSATATTFTVPGLLILHVRNGLITRVRDYMDGLGVPSRRHVI